MTHGERKVRSLNRWNWLRRGTWVSGRMNWRAFFHVLVFASLLGAHVYTALGVHATVSRPTDADEYAYMRAALSVFHGSGSYWLSPPPPPPNAMRIWPYSSLERRPLYPLWLSMLMHLDPAFTDFLEYLAEESWDSAGVELRLSRLRPDNLALYIEVLLGAIAIGLAWLAGRLVSGRLMVAHLSGLVALVVDDYAYYNTYLLTDNLVIPLFAGVNVCLAYLVRGSSRTKGRIAAVAVGCGVLLGALMLTRPPYEYLLLALPLAAVAWIYRDWSRRREIAVATTYILICASLVVMPWIVRNYATRGFVGFTEGYGPLVLSQRINYNDMTWTQWTAAFLYYSSVEGYELADKVFGPEVAPLHHSHPDHFHKRGSWGRELLAGVAPKDQLGFVLARVWSDLPKHLAVSVPLAWRGINKYRPSTYLFGIRPIWGVIFALGIFCSLAWGTRRNRTVLLALMFCPVVIFAIHVLVSFNVPRYNIGLVTPFAVGVALPIAWAIDGAWNRLRRWVP